MNLAWTKAAVKMERLLSYAATILLAVHRYVSQPSLTVTKHAIINL